MLRRRPAVVASHPPGPSNAMPEMMQDVAIRAETGTELHANAGKLDLDHGWKDHFFITGGAVRGRAREFRNAVPNPRSDKPLTVRKLRGAVNSMVN